MPWWHMGINSGTCDGFEVEQKMLGKVEKQSKISFRYFKQIQQPKNKTRHPEGYQQTFFLLNIG